MEERIYLKKARLKGYKSIIDTEATFSPGINIIIGDNGSGKTNFLEFLDYAMDSILPDSVGEKFQFLIGIDHSTAIGEVRYLEWEVNVVVNYVPTHANNSTIETFMPEVSGNCSINLDSKKIWLIKEGRHNSIDDFFKDVEHNLLGYFADVNVPIFSLSTMYFGIPAQIDEWYSKGLDIRLLFNPKNIVLTPLNSRLPLRHIFRLSPFPLKNLDFDVQNNLQRIPELIALSFSRGFVSRYKELISLYSPVKDIRINPYFNVIASNNFLVAKNLNFEFLVNNQWLHWDSLSNGTQRLFYIIVEILTTSSDIIVIEEPELGLYPSQLENLLDLVKEQSDDKQFIISTHSPQVLDILTIKELDRINIAEITKDGTKIKKLSPKNKRAAKAFYESTGIMSDYWRFDNLGLKP